MTLEPYGAVPGEVTEVSLTLRQNLTQQEWLDVGKNLGRAAQGVQWLIGDWLNYGVDHGYILYGKYDLASELTHMSKDWLYVCAWVARSFAPSERRAELSFTHHKQLASLKPGIERNALLQVAAQEGMSSRDLYNVSNQIIAPQVETTVVVPTSSVPTVEVPALDLPVPGALPPVQEGEVIELGQHRLIIGDATDSNIWKKLFAGQDQASVLWTDPPYGVDYSGKTQEAMTISHDTVADLPKLLAESLTEADKYLRDGSACYLCTGFTNHYLTQQIIEMLGWRFSVELVWIKNHFAMGRGDYHPQHESQLYAFKGNGRRWFGPQNRSTVFGLGPTDDGSFGYTIHRPSSSLRHPTMKPPKLIVEQVRNSALNGEVVLDPFAGSGSTMVAADILGLRAFMIEIDPKYGAEIVDRYREINGQG